jgi:4,5-dihydroxyphthalate decarboxylase
MKLQISVGCGDYDRTRAIHDGRVRIEGCDAVPVALEPEEVFFRAFRHSAFDVAELSFSSYLIATAAGRCPYVAVPAFVSRAFRHGAIYVRRDGPVRGPQDLKGRRVGVPEYQVTAAVWVRAMLQDDHGVAPSDIAAWVTGGVEEPGRHEKMALTLPPGVNAAPAPEGRALGEMLVAGEIDALVCPRPPSVHGDGSGAVTRLFPDPQAAAAESYARTGIFPIMHLIGVRRTLAEAHPWLPGSVYKAFRQARDIAVARLFDNAALAVSLAFMVEEAERMRSLMGGDIWPYGAAENARTIAALLDHHHRQGLSPRRLAVEEVFHPSTLESVKV